MINGCATLLARRLLHTRGGIALRAAACTPGQGLGGVSCDDGGGGRAAVGRALAARCFTPLPVLPLAGAGLASALRGGDVDWRAHGAPFLQLGRRPFSSASQPSTQWLVKIGNGVDYSLFSPPPGTPLKDIDSMTLLEALLKSTRFHNDLKDVPLGQCRVFVLQKVGGKRPTAQEELGTIELEGADTFSDVLPGCEHSGMVFVRVQLPGVAEGDTLLLQTATALRDAMLAATDFAVIPGRESAARLLRLPNGVGWPQLDIEPLFVRHFYQALYEGPLASLDPEGVAKTRKFTIVGTPGIGKSAFGCYILWQAVRARRTVVYASAKEKQTRVFHSSGAVDAHAFQNNFENVLGLLQLKSTVFIVDSAEPPSVSAFTVLITSPKRQRWKEFNKNKDATLLVVPVFSEEEIWDLKAAAYSDLDDAGVKERYCRWGGIPRYVLSKIENDDQKELDNALTSVNLSKITHLLQAKEIEDEDAISYHLLHLKCRGEEPGLHGAAPPPLPNTEDFYKLVRPVFASRHVADAVAKAMAKQQRKE